MDLVCLSMAPLQTSGFLSKPDDVVDVDVPLLRPVKEDHSVIIWIDIVPVSALLSVSSIL
jgi:hypothetical protein